MKRHIILLILFVLLVFGIIGYTQTPSPYALTESRLFEIIGRQSVQIQLLREENDRLNQELKTLKEPTPPPTTQK